MTLASSRPHCPGSCGSVPKRSASRRTKSSSSRNAPSGTPSQVRTKNAPWPHYSRTFEEKKKREKTTHHLQYSFFIVFISWSAFKYNKSASTYITEFTVYILVFWTFPFPRDFSPLKIVLSEILHLSLAYFFSTSFELRGLLRTFI